ncbi:transcription factor HHO5-like [Impatiens glandulifera]|uniref:transcription factor HHO5-like n=1 Tax=Impatiens glandulifera TaxID=253017 RepID=UPI001FB07681|nr:transcription factor HHO5-like [Impatiens glandulifera]
MNPGQLVPTIISEFLESISTIRDLSLKSSKLNDFILKLEDEIEKIIPANQDLSIEKLKEQILVCEIPGLFLVEGNSGGVEGEDMEGRGNLEKESTKINENEVGDGGSIPIKKPRVTFREFPPFTGKAIMPRSGENGGASSSGGFVGEGSNKGKAVLDESLTKRPRKKQRRSWSKEMRMKFGKAVKDLGGAQYATPKNIIKEMKVDGLTGDEVKSHLQKYRTNVGNYSSKKKSGRKGCNYDFIFKVHRVLPSSRWYSTSSRRIQFQRVHIRVSGAIVTPFVHVATYATGNFAT